MVSLLSIWMMTAEIMITVFVPLLFIITLLILKKISFIPVLTGALSLLIFQRFLRIPLWSVISKMPSLSYIFDNIIIQIILLGLIASLFDELGRLIGCKTLMRKHLEWRDGFALGLGAGAFESITFAVYAIKNLYYAYAINSGTFSELAAVLPSEMATQIYNSIINANPFTYLVCGIGSIFAIIIQIALSILVVYAVRKKEYAFILLAIALHFVIECPWGLLFPIGYNIMGICIFICAAYYIFRSRKHFAALE